MAHLQALMMSLLFVHQSYQESVLQYTVGTTEVNLSYTQEWMLHIYPSIRMNLSGQVFAFEFLANNTGKVVFGVWDVVSETTFRLHRKQRCLVKHLGKQECKLGPKNRFLVSANQVLGVHHELTSEGHMVPIAMDDCCGIQTDPSMSYNLLDSQLPEGYIVQNGNASTNTAAVVVHIRKIPIVTFAGNGSTDVIEYKHPLACFAIPQRSPGMISYHFVYNEPIPNLAVRVYLKGGPCELVFVYWTVKIDGLEKSHRICTLVKQLEGKFISCSFVCFFDRESGNNMASAFNMRIIHQGWPTKKLCWVNIEEK